MKKLVTIAMTVGIMCISVPLVVCAQSTEYWWQCPPGSVNTVCVEINGYGQGKAYTLPATPMTTPERAMGECAPNAVNRTCVEINGRGASKTAWEIPAIPKRGTSLGEWLK